MACLLECSQKLSASRIWCGGRCAFTIVLEWCAERHRSEHPAWGRIRMKLPGKEERRAEIGETGKGRQGEVGRTGREET